MVASEWLEDVKEEMAHFRQEGWSGVRTVVGG